MCACIHCESHRAVPLPAYLVRREGLRVDVVEARLLALLGPAVGERLPRLALVVARVANREDTVAPTLLLQQPTLKELHLLGRGR